VRLLVSVVIVMFAIAPARAEYLLCPSDEFTLTGTDKKGVSWLSKHGDYLKHVHILYFKELGETQFSCTTEGSSVERYMRRRCRIIPNGSETKVRDYGKIHAEVCTLKPQTYDTNDEQCRVVCD
jgi:hypothetical protein